ncbi:hypothetical protein BN7_1142 [Wickerhamomyces ciferrii]|uniref:DRBM domain-containing protein n=1 Tax=Wickerhamomyces ciferrii (strain ATCC 14091 / BCRC 22168 / CBS 111 / JCM 3599 / NBRC 0793 / NRRL Y-1031 F-60-10) TaxID=1206466 RepID=K0KF66_WICCF|nr:uncharacterized protein BN7_1142 [Wickerhamomyces ciferrii]CCH41601.1 hypothetical protein BN7_1142 [Wickerhamomyces ciferrii]
MLRCIIRGVPRCSKLITRRSIVPSSHAIPKVNTGFKIQRFQSTSRSGQNNQILDSSKIEDINLRKYYDYLWEDVEKKITLKTSKSKLQDLLSFTLITYENEKIDNEITSKCFINDKLFGVAKGETIKEAEQKAAMNVFFDGKDTMFNDYWLPISKKKLKIAKIGDGDKLFSKNYQNFINSNNLNFGVDSNNSKKIIPEDSDIKLDDVSNLKLFFLHELRIAKAKLTEDIAIKKLEEFVQNCGFENASIEYRVIGNRTKKMGGKPIVQFQMECFINNIPTSIAYHVEEKKSKKMAAVNALLRGEKKLFEEVWLPLTDQYFTYNQEKPSLFIQKYKEFLEKNKYVMNFKSEVNPEIRGAKWVYKSYYNRLDTDTE